MRLSSHRLSKRRIGRRCRSFPYERRGIADLTETKDRPELAGKLLELCLRQFRMQVEEAAAVRIIDVQLRQRGGVGCVGNGWRAQHGRESNGADCE
jgi:hypothetical protein